MHHPARTLAGLSLALLAGCQSTAPRSGAETPMSRPVGGDRDAHGCLPAAGYSWCERLKACVRPWELAEEKGFALEPASFDRYCNQPATTP